MVEYLFSKHNEIISKYIDEIVVSSKISANTVEYLHISELFTLQVYLLSNSTNARVFILAAQLCLHINAQWSSFAICVFFNSLTSPE